MKISKLFLVVIVSILILFSTPLKVLGDEVSDKLADIQKQINELQKQLDGARTQEKTLKSQLSYIDTQTKLTQLKVDETTTQIAKLDQEISDLSTRITRLSSTVDNITQVLLYRITQTYKFGNITSVDLLFSSRGFSDLLNRIKYVQVAQENDKKVLYQLQATKATYNDQKVDKKSRQEQQEKLKKDLERYQLQLVDQKKGKEELLKITQNNEAVYQAKIRAAQEEQNAILAILSGKGHEVPEGPTTKGSTVGYIIYGKSACSSGTHLHFEVHQNGSIQDPNNFLSNTSFSYSDNDGGGSEGAISPHGSWDWPLSGNIYISQGYGMTPYARAGAYNGSPHTGIDMYSSSLIVKAVGDGSLSKGGIPCGGGTLNYKKVDHGDGTVAYFLHVL